MIVSGRPGNWCRLRDAGRGCAWVTAAQPGNAGGGPGGGGCRAIAACCAVVAAGSASLMIALRPASCDSTKPSGGRRGEAAGVAGGAAKPAAPAAGWPPVAAAVRAALLASGGELRTISGVAGGRAGCGGWKLSQPVAVPCFNACPPAPILGALRRSAPPGAAAVLCLRCTCLRMSRSVANPLGWGYLCEKGIVRFPIKQAFSGIRPVGQIPGRTNVTNGTWCGEICRAAAGLTETGVAEAEATASD